MEWFRGVSLWSPLTMPGVQCVDSYRMQQDLYMRSMSGHMLGRLNSKYVMMFLEAEAREKKSQ